MKIKNVKASEVLDSRGNPTIETRVILENGISAKATVPSGASTGSKEALELRDEDKERFNGKGVLQACENVEQKIAPKIRGLNVFNQQKIDQDMLALDGTENKSKLGANAILSVSLAVARTAVKEADISLWKYLRKTFDLKENENYNFPIPMMNVINGGKHADSGLDFQEYMLVPLGLKTVRERIFAGAEIYQILKKNLVIEGFRIALGDEGGFAPKLQTNEEPLEKITEAIKSSRYQLGTEIKMGMDVAASEFYNRENENYELKLGNISLESAQLSSMYKEWLKKYEIALIEDPMSEFDLDGWSEFNQAVGNEIAVIGDDLLVTNKKLVQKAIEKKACNTVLIKVNQIGSLTKTMETIKLAKDNHLKIAVSHRSGETTDDFIADLAVATQAEYVKFGAPARGERVGKYNRLMEIEREVKGK